MKYSGLQLEKVREHLWWEFGTSCALLRQWGELSRVELRTRFINCIQEKESSKPKPTYDKDPSIAEICSTAKFSTHEVDATGDGFYESLIFTLKELNYDMSHLTVSDMRGNIYQSIVFLASWLAGESPS